MEKNWVDLDAVPVSQVIGPKPAGATVGQLSLRHVGSGTIRALISHALFGAVGESWRTAPAENGMLGPLGALIDQAMDALRAQIPSDSYLAEHDHLDAKFEARLHEGARGVPAAVTLRREGNEMQTVIMLADELASAN